MKWMALILILPSLAFAGGPKSAFPQPRGLDAEIINIYHDLANPVINIGTASTMTVTYLNISTIAVNGQILSGGRVFQIVSSVVATNADTTSVNFTDMGFGVSITPSDTSHKVLVMFCGLYYVAGSAGGVAAYSIARGGSNILSTASGVGGIEVEVAALLNRSHTCIAYLDSPASTSALTYTLMAKSDAGTTTTSIGGGSTFTFSSIAVEVK